MIQEEKGKNQGSQQKGQYLPKKYLEEKKQKEKGNEKRGSTQRSKKDMELFPLYSTTIKHMSSRKGKAKKSPPVKKNQRKRKNQGK